MKKQVWLILGLFLVCLSWTSQTCQAELWGYYPIGDNDYDDYSGNARHGTALGALTAIEDPDKGWVLDLPQAAGLTPRIQLPGDDPAADGSMGICMWIKWFGTDGRWQGMLGKSVDYQNRAWIFQLRDSVGTVHFPSHHTTVTPPENEWVHIAATLDNGTSRIYLNGAQEFEATGTNPPNSGIGETARLTIGHAEDRNDRDLRFNGLIDEVCIFTHAPTEDEILASMTSKIRPELASRPQPAHEAVDVSRDVVLGWNPGELAEIHNVYLGTDLGDVTAANTADPLGVLVSQEQSDNRLDPGRLTFSQTYYWRVDEVNGPAPQAVFIGDVWQFTVEPEATPIERVTATASSAQSANMGPENTVNGSGMNDAGQHSTAGSDMWLTSALDTERWIQYEFDKPYKLHEMRVWNQNQTVEVFVGFGVKDVTIETSLDGNQWTSLPGAHQFNQAPGLPGYAHNTTIAFGGQMAQWVKITIDSGWGGIPQNGLSEVRFLAVPVLARNPLPAEGATTDSVDVTLQWSPGREADTHEVILSDDGSIVEDGSAVIGGTQENSYQPSPLTYSRTYFWRIDEVNQVETPTRHEGTVWSFQTPEYLIVDDFETYQDKEFKEIWSVWADGYQDPDNGAIVGNDNEAEKSVIYSERKSMPLHYDNSSASISETTRTFNPHMDWTMGSPSTLSLYVRGNAPAFREDSNGRITVGGAGADIWMVEDEFRFAYKQLNGDGAIVARIHSLTHTHDWAKAGVMIRESLTQESSFAGVFLTGDNGVRYQARLQPFVLAEDDGGVVTPEQSELVAPVWIKIERVGNEYNGYYATDEAGTNWIAMSWNPQTIGMAPSVFIGLAVTSHSIGVTAAAEFSDVQITGGVSGAWATEAIGLNHPSNDAAPMYVTVADALGREQSILHTNPNATIITDWDQWIIPLSTLNPVDLTQVKSISIGVGDPSAAPSGAMGTAYIDLLRIGTPR